MQRLLVQRLRTECSRMWRWRAAHWGMVRSRTTRMAAAAVWAAHGESLVKSTLANQVLVDGASVDGVLVDGALDGGTLGGGVLKGNALVPVMVTAKKTKAMATAKKGAMQISSVEKIARKLK